MSCPTCDAINAAILAKAKAVADALLVLFERREDVTDQAAAIPTELAQQDVDLERFIVDDLVSRRVWEGYDTAHMLTGNGKRKD